MNQSNQFTGVYGYLGKPSLIDFPGHMAAVLFTSGCNFRCGFCHNAELMGKPQNGLTWQKLEKALSDFRKQWVDGVVITGGEPTLLPNLKSLIEWLRAKGFDVKLDTNGSNPQVLETLAPLLDYVAMDVKADLTGYQSLTGFNDPDRIRESISFIKEHIPEHEFRTTVLESVHTDDVMKQIHSLVNGARKYALQPFVPRETLPDPKFKTMQRTSPDRMKYLAELMQDCASEVVCLGSS